MMGFDLSVTDIDQHSRIEKDRLDDQSDCPRHSRKIHPPPLVEKLPYDYADE